MWNMRAGVVQRHTHRDADTFTSDAPTVTRSMSPPRAWWRVRAIRSAQGTRLRRRTNREICKDHLHRRVCEDPDVGPAWRLTPARVDVTRTVRAVRNPRPFATDRYLAHDLTTSVVRTIRYDGTRTLSGIGEISRMSA